MVVVCEEEDIVPGEARGFKSTNSSQPTNREKTVGARQLVRQDGGSGGQFYGAQPLQPTQTRAPTGERLQKT